MRGKEEVHPDPGVESMTLLADVTAASEEVSRTSSRLAKVRTLAGCLREVEPGEIPIAVAFLTGAARQARLGISYTALQTASANAPAPQPSLTLAKVDEAFSDIAVMSGTGAASRRAARLAVLFGQATAAEQDFLARLIMGELRQGALKGLMLDAIAAAADIPVAEVRRAAMSAGGIGEVACAALATGAAGLARFSIRLMQPVLPMLSQPVEDINAALRKLGNAAFEWKLDGARVQVHKAGAEVRVYTRNLNDVTAAVPEIVETVSAAPADELILDGEAIALRPDGSPRSFQLTMSRFGRKLDVEAMRLELPLSVFFFDCLLRNGEVLAALPADERFRALGQSVPAATLIPRLVTADAAQAASFFEGALRHGHEGVMAKALDTPYEAGRRGAAWLKIKRTNTLDLVVLAAEWGHGRRRGLLSNLHLGARDAAGDSFVMLGKTFKGLNDKMLEWQTQEFLKRERSRDGFIVYLRPEIVVEVAFNEVQKSAQYPGGLALRFARVKGYRPDKRPDEADTIETVRKIYESQVHARS
jgi:DNA ligase-1